MEVFCSVIGSDDTRCINLVKMSFMDPPPGGLNRSYLRGPSSECHLSNPIIRSNHQIELRFLCNAEGTCWGKFFIQKRQIMHWAHTRESKGSPVSPQCPPCDGICDCQYIVACQRGGVFKNATWRWQWALPIKAIIPQSLRHDFFLECSKYLEQNDVQMSNFHKYIFRV